MARSPYPGVCPFCWGVAAEIVPCRVIKPTLSNYAVECPTCKARGPAHKRRHVAVDTWNILTFTQS